ncbi:MAG: cellulose 1,4-beta-cellobiosidase [Actinomycetota bacterium]|nr:cellulose 1,4-beta-cellobiosidase [Actinomycetota bacterium]
MAFGVVALAASTFVAPATAAAHTVTANVATVNTTTKRLDNPYLGAKLYVDPEWSAQASSSGGQAIANQPTAIWLNNLVSIPGNPWNPRHSMGLAAHLDTALGQGANTVQIVLNSLPGRNCAWRSKGGELQFDEIDQYRTEYIDPIVEILSRSQYAGLRIVTVIEPESLSLLVRSGTPWSVSTPECEQVPYVEGIAYALTRLRTVPNVYTYLDAAQHGRMGWGDNFPALAALLANTARRTPQGLASVDGFIVNTTGYSALSEPFLTVTQRTRRSTWVDWNDYVDELSYARGLRTRLIELGFDPGIGMLIDTSRNGWGGPDRPRRASTSTDLDTWVDESRVDRRYHASDWCNQAGAGLGERPQASPVPGIDAYVWAQPPGESDGKALPEDFPEAKGFERMCTPGDVLTGPHERPWFSGALAGSPLPGEWFPAQFAQLLANAYPPVGQGPADEPMVRTRTNPY